ncbi:MAG TPA: hypothetical protein DHV28_09105 [Ignavibacteriales bacterium]|nr:hypothetical protein [Ignavibacteriales bacterium]
MKNFFKFLGVLFLLISFIACSDEPPSFRVKNEYTAKVNFQIKTTANTENINDVQSGTVTDYKEVAEGRVEITAEIQGLTDEPTGVFNAERDNNYTLVVTNENPPKVRIDVSNK